MQTQCSPFGFSVKKSTSNTYLDNVRWQYSQDSAFYRLGVFGASGSGKTTLLQSVAGLRDGVEYQLNHAGLQHTGYGPNHPAVYVGSDAPLFSHLTVKDNLTLIARKARFAGQASTTLEQIIDWCKISHLLTQYPSSLSGGETQRVNFARAIASGKPLLLLDEAFSALDNKNRQYMLTLVNYLCEQHQKSCIMVSHALQDLAVTCDHMLVIGQGKIMRSGRTEDVLPLVQQEVDEEEVFWSLLHVENATLDKRNELIAWRLTQATQNDAEAQQWVYQKYSDKTGQMLNQNTPARLIVEASSVSLSRHRLHNTSFINQIAATITDIEHKKGGYLVKSITCGQSVCAFISSASYNTLKFEPGQSVWLIFKAL